MSTSDPHGCGDACSFVVVPAGPGRVELHVLGELDVWSGTTLAAVVDGNRHERIALDLSAVTFVDVAGHTAIETAVARRGVRIEVVATSASVERLACMLPPAAPVRGPDAAA